jgi:hypothetical protein
MGLTNIRGMVSMVLVVSTCLVLYLGASSIAIYTYIFNAGITVSEDCGQ